MKMKKCNKVIHAMALLLAVVMFVPIIIGQTVISAQAKTLKLSDKKLELMPDEFYELKVENAGSKKVTWKSSDKKVISVTAKGKVHAVGNAGESCTITATIGKKTLKCQASIMDIREYGTYLIWNSNWTYTGYDINGKKVTGVVPGYMEVFKWKGSYYYVIETEGGSEGTEYIAHDYSVMKIGKKLPSYLKNPVYAIYPDGKAGYLAKKLKKNEDGWPAVNILYDAKGNLVVEKARNYTDKQWKNRLKKLGYK